MENKLIQQAVSSFASLPGIGKKTAQRLVFHMLNQEKEYTQSFAHAIQTLREQIQYCTSCGNISEASICSICKNPGRNHSLICVVEHFKDLFAVEATGSFSGVYHVLGGLISPIDGLGPEQLRVQELAERIEDKEDIELILALSTSIQGDTTAFYLANQFPNTKVTTLARGVSFGGDLEYVDDLTLGRSLLSRTPFNPNSDLD